jgi:hypothetical protein
MAQPCQSSNPMKPWAWLAAVAAVCLVLATSTALYAINSAMRLGLPWWTAVVVPVLVYALVLPLCVPRIRLSGWITGFVTLAVLHGILGLVTTWLYASVGLTSFGEALAPAFWSFPPALVLEMVGSLLMTLPFLGALAPRSAAPRVQTETASPRAAAPKRPMQEVSAAPEQSRHVWARPTEPPAAPVAAVLSAVPPPATVAPVVEEPMAAPEQHGVHAAPLLGTNGSTLDVPEPGTQKPSDFRHALIELFGDPLPERKAEAVPELPLAPVALEPTAIPSAEVAAIPSVEVAAIPSVEAPAVPSAEVPERAVPEPRATPPVETPATMTAPGAPAPAGAMVRISFDRVVGQLPPAAFRVPLAQVGANLLEPGTLLVAQTLIVPQLGEGVVQVEWEAVVEQFPPAVFAVTPADVKQRIVNGRLLLPLDEIVRQLSSEVFGASMGRRPVEVPGIESFPAPFKPLGREGRAPAPAPAAVVREVMPAPARDLAPPPTAVEPEVVAAPAREPASPPGPVRLAESLPPIESSPAIPPLKALEPMPLLAPTPPLEPLAKAEPAPAVAFAQADAPQVIEVPSAAEITEDLRKWTLPHSDVKETPRAEPGQVAASTPAVPAAAKLALESVSDAAMAAAAPPVEPAAEVKSEATTEPVIRIPFDRVMAQLPPDQFRFPLERVGARLHEPGSLLVPLALIVPQLGEGAVHAAWEAVVGQFPVEAFAAAPADVKSHIEEGHLLLPLDEIVRQLPPDVFGGAMARGPVHVPGIESFPAPFKPLEYEEATPIAVPPASAAPQPEPVIAADPLPAFASPVPLPLATSPDPARAPAAPEITEPEIAAAPQPVPVAPLYEARIFERPIPVEPPATLLPERRGHAAMVAALMAPLETAALEEAQIGDFNIISVSTAGMPGGTVAAAAGRLSPLMARGAPQPIDQVTLRGLGGALVLTPVGSGWSSGTALAVGTRTGGALARLEMLASRAARHEPGSPPASPRNGAPFPRLEVTPAPPAVTAAAQDLTIFGPLAPQSFREPASGAVVHCLVSPGTLAADLAPFACELAQTMAQATPAGALGAFHSAVLRSGSRRVEIRRLQSAAGLALILVVGGNDTGRPGLARLQVERTAARLSVA